MNNSTLISSLSAQELLEKLNSIENKIDSLEKTSQKPEFERPISVKQAAEFLGVAQSTIRNKITLRQLPYYTLFKGTKYVFFESQLVEYIKTGRVKTVKEINVESAEFVEAL